MTDYLLSDSGAGTADGILDGVSRVLIPDFARPINPVSSLHGRVEFTGPIVEEFQPSYLSSRTHLNLPTETFFGVLALGGVLDRPRNSRIVGTAIRSWMTLAPKGSQLCILGQAPAGVSPEIHGRSSVIWLGAVPDANLYYAAADVVIANDRGFTSCELVYNSIPTVVVASDPDANDMTMEAASRIDTLSKWCGFALVNELSAEAIWTAVLQVRSGRSTAVPDFGWASGKSFTDILMREVLDVVN